MTNIQASEVAASIVNNMSEDQREKLLIAYVAQETEKKVFEINKNHPNDEAKRDFKLKQLESLMNERLFKKVVSIDMKAAYAASLNK